ncbi:hypothetical protein HRM2_15680 [Desulforapulum autotrophicum HRM2]|uniref:Uncharacterized protein n=1 Tax=Desulforapulum autotrophicum (strain ATCC 43914 / DSM 3382 / VKM B-1955 / HRM2) TaxID=177437 RepID=C0QA92_DESAH|nr:hypothetical protein HRM2_15680 [Desulforapulum autotrophicum HRM2]
MGYEPLYDLNNKRVQYFKKRDAFWCLPLGRPGPDKGSDPAGNPV